MRDLLLVLAWAIGLELANPWAQAAAAVLADLATTIYGMRRPRMGEDAPVQRWAIQTVGLVPGVVLLHLLPLVATFLLRPALWVFAGYQLNPIAPAITAVVFGAVALNNVRLILRT
jgi:hypothetical protein